MQHLHGRRAAAFIRSVYGLCFTLAIYGADAREPDDQGACCPCAVLALSDGGATPVPRGVPAVVAGAPVPESNSGRQQEPRPIGRAGNRVARSIGPIKPVRGHASVAPARAAACRTTTEPGAPHAAAAIAPAAVIFVAVPGASVKEGFLLRGNVTVAPAP